MVTLTKKLLPFALIAFAMPAFAAYTGPNSEPSSPVSVAEIMKNPIDDTQVSLVGYVTRKIPGSKDHYEFKDIKGGMIDVEIDHDKWPSGVNINDKTKVRITGEVDVDHDYGRRFVNIDVDSILTN